MGQENKKDLIKTDILAKIGTGLLVAGQMIEPETTMAPKYNVSRMTLRKAIDELIFEGCLMRVPNKGTFVCPKAKFEGFRFGLGYSDEICRKGMTPSSREVCVKLEYADKRAREDLALSAEQQAWHVYRLRLADNIPVAYEDAYFPYPLVPLLDNQIATGSIYEYLERENGLSFSYADQTVDAVAADTALSRLLEVAVGWPLVRTYSVAYLQNGTPFNSGLCYYRTDQIKLLQSVKR